MPYNYDPAIKSRVDIESIVKAFNQEGEVYSSKSTFRVVATEDSKMELKMHTGLASIRLGAAAERARREQAAVDIIKLGIDNRLGPGAGSEVFRLAGVNEASISGRQFEAVMNRYNEYAEQLKAALVNGDRANVNQWKNAAANPVPDPSKALPGELQNLLKDSQIKWKLSDSGMGGALIGVKANGQGVVVKIEDSQATQKAALLSSLMKQALPPGSGAFEVAGVTDETMNQAGVAALKEKLTQLSKEFAKDPDKVDVLKKHQKLLESGKDLGVTKMDFVAGTQLNKLTLDDRAAMLQSGVVARELGKAAAICPVMGLCDHASPTGSGLPTNLSNFMMDSNTGKLAPIDFDIKPSKDFPGTFRADSAVNGVEELTTYLQAATASQEAFNAAVNDLVEDAKMGSERTPLCNCLMGLTQPEGNVEGLFSPKENEAVQNLVNNQALQRQLAVDLLKGAAEGLQCVKENQATINQAMASTEHVLNAAETEKLAAVLGGADFQAIQQNLDSLARDQGVSLPVVAQNAPNVPGPGNQVPGGWSASVKREQEMNPQQEKVRESLLGRGRKPAAADGLNVAVQQPADLNQEGPKPDVRASLGLRGSQEREPIAPAELENVKTEVKEVKAGSVAELTKLHEAKAQQHKQSIGGEKTSVGRSVGGP
jgi:hypothetical protein